MPDHVEPDVPQWSPVPDAFLGIYSLGTRDNLHRTAEFIALEESAGSWSGGSAATPLYARSLGRVHDVRQLSQAAATLPSPTRRPICPSGVPPSPPSGCICW